MTDNKRKRQHLPPPEKTVRGSGGVGTIFSQPLRTKAKSPDWDFWRAMRKAKEWQACALSLNIDPDSMKGHPQAWMAGPDSGPFFTSDSFPSNDEQVKFEKRLKLLRANRYDRAIFTQPIAKNSGLVLDEVFLSEFAAWGLSIAWNDMPPELVMIAKPVSLSPTQSVPPLPVISADEWSALVEQEEEARKDPVYKAKYDHAMSLHDERDRLLECLRQEHPYVDIEIKKRLSEIRTELAEIDKVEESNRLCNEMQVARVTPAQEKQELPGTSQIDASKSDRAADAKRPDGTWDREALLAEHEALRKAGSTSPTKELAKKYGVSETVIKGQKKAASDAKKASAPTRNSWFSSLDTKK